VRVRIADLSREEHALFNELLTREFGLYFPESKRQILHTRLEPRLRELRLPRFFDYYLRLQYALDSERDYLVQRVTNHETYFFRETSQFESLFGSVMADLLRTAVIPGQLRLLSAGCSTGEEPYTLAIYALQNRIRLQQAEVKVDAFDLDGLCIEQARCGHYGPRSLRSTTPERARQYFQERTPGNFRLRELYRRGVSFRTGNIVDESSFRGQRYDAIFCRNVLIYFAEGALRRAIENFARALRPGGILFLGHSESIIGMNPLLETVRLDSCIAYRKVAP
jgi:chemotaxis protein methyltransferase CheR